MSKKLHKSIQIMKNIKRMNDEFETLLVKDGEDSNIQERIFHLFKLGKSKERLTYQATEGFTTYSFVVYSKPEGEDFYRAIAEYDHPDDALARVELIIERFGNYNVRVGVNEIRVHGYGSYEL